MARASNGAPPAEPSPRTPVTTPSPQPPQPSQPAAHHPPIFVGALIALAAVKEIIHRLGEQPITVQARGISRADTTLGIAVLVRALERVGRAVLGAGTKRV